MNVKLDATFWDEAYRSRDAAWSSEPDEHIVDIVGLCRPVAHWTSVAVAGTSA